MTAQTISILSEIRTADDQFESNFRSADATSLAGLYTEQGMIFPTGSDAITGKKGIKDFWQGVMDMGIKEAKLDIVEVELQGDVAIELGRYKLKGSEGNIMDEGKYIVIWKQEGSEWRLHRDIWNTNKGQ